MTAIPYIAAYFLMGAIIAAILENLFILFEFDTRVSLFRAVFVAVVWPWAIVKIIWTLIMGVKQ